MPRVLVETWTQIAAIQKRQKTDPDYQFAAEMPPVSASGTRLGDGPPW